MARCLWRIRRHWAHFDAQELQYVQVSMRRYIEKQRGETANRPSILCTHHPPWETGPWVQPGPSVLEGIQVVCNGFIWP